MSIPKFSVKRPVAISMIFLAILILGIISVSLLKIEMLPRIPIPKIVIETLYPNAAPEEVEELVTKPLEETLSTLEGLKTISSASSRGKSFITLEFFWQTDIDFVTLKAREKLDRIKWSLPEEVERPNILNFDPAEKPIISYAITGMDNLYMLSQMGENLIARRFEQIPGVAKAELSGTVEQEIVIQVSPQKLFLYDITPDMIANKVRQLNATYSGGELIDGWYKYSVLFPQNLQTEEDVKNITVRNINGDKFLLSDLGRVYAQPKLRETIAKVNGHEGIILNIIKNSDANTVEVCRLVRQSADNWNAQQSRGNNVYLELLHDDSQIVIDSILSVVQAIIIGGILAFFVLMLFLKGIKSPITVAISMPVAIITAFILMYFSGISLNILSMGGLAIGIGLLVDTSIIVLENIVRHREENQYPLDKSCIIGAEEVMLSISAGTFTTVAVFFPIIYLQGVSGVFFKQQALTITFALLASLGIAMTLVPSLYNRGISSRRLSHPQWRKVSFQPSTMLPKSLRFFYPVINFCFIIKEWIKHVIKLVIYWLRYIFLKLPASILRKINRRVTPLGERNERFWLRVRGRYENLLAKALDNRRLTITITVGVFLVSLFVAQFIPTRFIPELTPDRLNIIVEQPSGVPLNITREKMELMEEVLLAEKGISNVEAFIGEEHTEAGLIAYKKNAAHKGYFVVTLNRKELRDISTYKSYLQDKLNPMIDGNVSVVTGGTVYEDIFYFGDYPYEIRLYGEHFDELERNTRLVQTYLTNLTASDHPMFSEVKTDLQMTKPTFRLTFNDNILRSYQLSRYDVARKLQELNFGYTIDELVYGNEVKPIVLRTYERNPEKRNLTLSEFMQQQILINGNSFSVSDLVGVEQYLSPEEIYHHEQQRTTTIYAKLHSEVNYATGLQAIQNALQDFSQKYSFRYEITGENERIQENFGGLIFAFILAIILVYMILGVQFESFKLPFVIILTIPLTIIGVIWGLLITGISINLMSLIGVVVLVGICVNDSIVKIDTIRRLREQGMELIEAVKKAGKQRFRPIIMTSLTTIVGLLPLAIGLGSGTELTQPLAITVVFGLCASTFLTLFVIPVIYVLFEKQQKEKK